MGPPLWQNPPHGGTPPRQPPHGVTPPQQDSPHSGTLHGVTPTTAAPPTMAGPRPHSGSSPDQPVTADLVPSLLLLEELLQAQVRGPSSFLPTPPPLQGQHGGPPTPLCLQGGQVSASVSRRGYLHGPADPRCPHWKLCHRASPQPAPVPVPPVQARFSHCWP